LQHAAGQLARPFLRGVGRQTGQRELQPRQLAAGGMRQVGMLEQGRGNIVFHRQRRKQRAILEQHAETRAQPVHLRRIAVPHGLSEQFDPPGLWPQKADDFTQQH